MTEFKLSVVEVQQRLDGQTKKVRTWMRRRKKEEKESCGMEKGDDTGDGGKVSGIVCNQVVDECVHYCGVQYEG